MTQELEKLYDDYYKMFDRTPDGYMELEYGEGSYKAYVRDIKKSLKLNRIGSEGLSSHSVEGESLSWSENDFAGYMDDIRAYLDDQKESKKGKVRFL